MDTLLDNFRTGHGVITSPSRSAAMLLVTHDKEDAIATADHRIDPPTTITQGALDSGSAGDSRGRAFLVGLAHDLRQVLTVISCTTQLAERRIGATATPLDTMLAALRTFQGATDRMALLIAELEDFATLEADQALTLDRRAVDLVAMARETAARYAAVSECHRFLVIVESTDGSPVVGEWDAGKLERVLDNLVGNALKFSPAGGSITIKVGRESAPATDTVDSELAVLQVCDEGVGIPAHELPDVFEWFRRAGNATGVAPGKGIGLALVRQIIQQHGGTVHAASKESHGSTFTLRLPLASLDHRGVA